MNKGKGKAEGKAKGFGKGASAGRPAALPGGGYGKMVARREAAKVKVTKECATRVEKLGTNQPSAIGSMEWKARKKKKRQVPNTKRMTTSKLPQLGLAGQLYGLV